MMNPPSEKKIDLAAIRARLSGKGGRQYWRSLEELAETEQFQDYLHREFPRHASEWDASLDRRQFVQLMAASLALGGMAGCNFEEPPELIVPYVRQPERVVPGEPLYFATAMPQGDGAIGLLVESHMGRPTKIEGNPDHPSSLGATDAFAQASVLTMYDPDRSQTVRHLGNISTWETLLVELRAALAVQRQRGGAGLRILTEAFSSPTLGRQMEQLLEQFPEARWHVHEPVDRQRPTRAEAVFGEEVHAVHQFDEANVVLSLDSDFLCQGPSSVRKARDFMSRRRVRGERAEMNRLYVVESTPSNTGAAADHRLPLAAGEIETFARQLAAALGVASEVATPARGGAAGGRFNPAASEAQRAWLAAVAGDLRSNEGRSLIVAGVNQPPIVHALVHAMNEALGNVGRTISYTQPLQTGPIDRIGTLAELTEDLAADRVELLLIVGGNPVYTAPVDLDFAAELRKARLAVHLNLYNDATSLLCHWHVPQSHFLETWSDVRAYDGTASIMQPLIAPLYQSRSAHELLSGIVDPVVQSSYDAVRDTWQAHYDDLDETDFPEFEGFWESALHAGVIPETAFSPREVQADLTAELLERPQGGLSPDDLELIFAPDPNLWDGRYANNGWLQELPRPLTKLTWDNAALISPVLAEAEGLRNEDVVKLTYAGRTLEMPVWVLPGQPERSVTVHLGFGRQDAGRVGNGVGFNAYELRTRRRPWFGWGLEIEKTSRRFPLATTQDHHSMEGRDIVRSGTLEQYKTSPDFAHAHVHFEGAPPSLYPEYPYEGHAWGMAIDLTTCVGCNACVVACQAENNIPIVGKAGVMRGREMHWLRIDRYFAGDLDNPKVLYQPMLCQHCEKAPCEVVCPVAATTHSPEGLNEMTYNRCVGTRYCSNNCPYKVRRFNFFDYTAVSEPVEKMQHNPDVTVRSRGVMEKCTYCVQRINQARIDAKIRDVDARAGAPADAELSTAVRIPDGAIVTACQQACPTQAIVFGDQNDPTTAVSQLKALPLNYGVLAELGTQPRTTYLAQLSNPHPDLVEATEVASSEGEAH